MGPAHFRNWPENLIILLDPSQWTRAGTASLFFESHIFFWRQKVRKVWQRLFAFFMSERRYAIPTVEQIEQHKRKSKGTNYFKTAGSLSSSVEAPNVTPTPNVSTEIPRPQESSAVTSNTDNPNTTPAQSAGGPRRLGPNAILVNQAQRGNPILQHVRNVPWEYDDIKPDYIVGQTTCVLYLR